MKIHGCTPTSKLSIDYRFFDGHSSLSIAMFPLEVVGNIYVVSALANFFIEPITVLTTGLFAMNSCEYVNRAPSLGLLS
jgi:hypothetical protein